MYDKMKFEDVDFVNDALFNAFHPSGIEEGEDIDRRMDALFDIFLEFANWTSEEYWNEVHERHHHECNDCKAERELAEEKKKSESN